MEENYQNQSKTFQFQPHHQTKNLKFKNSAYGFFKFSRILQNSFIITCELCVQLNKLSIDRATLLTVRAGTPFYIHNMKNTTTTPIKLLSRLNISCSGAYRLLLTIKPVFTIAPLVQWAKTLLSVYLLKSCTSFFNHFP